MQLKNYERHGRRNVPETLKPTVSEIPKHLLSPAPNPCGKKGVQVKLEVVAYAPCPVHGPLHENCDCPKIETDRECKEDDATLKQFAQLVQALLLASTQTITDTSSVGHSVANASATTAPTICAGTNNTAVVFTDVALNTQTETASGTVNAISSNTFSISGSVLATADRIYVEIGLRVTNGGNLYMITRDIIVAKNVSDGGTLATTITLTWS